MFAMDVAKRLWDGVKWLCDRIGWNGLGAIATALGVLVAVIGIRYAWVAANGWRAQTYAQKRAEVAAEILNSGLRLLEAVAWASHQSAPANSPMQPVVPDDPAIANQQVWLQVDKYIDEAVRAQYKAIAQVPEASPVLNKIIDKMAVLKLASNEYFMTKRRVGGPELPRLRAIAFPPLGQLQELANELVSVLKPIVSLGHPVELPVLPVPLGNPKPTEIAEMNKVVIARNMDLTDLGITLPNDTTTFDSSEAVPRFIASDVRPRAVSQGVVLQFRAPPVNDRLSRAIDVALTMQDVRRMIAALEAMEEPRPPPAQTTNPSAAR